MANSTGWSRFDSPTFVVSRSSDENVPGSPRKKQKRDRGDLEEEWKKAVAEMLKDKEEADDDDDDLPEVGAAFNFVGLYKPVSAAPLSAVELRGGKGKRKRKDGLDLDGRDSEGGEGEEKGDRWSPPPADDGLDIPGERVLARDTNGATYWPARILAYVPPTSLKEKGGKYEIEYLDGTKDLVTRGWFYTSDDDAFAICKASSLCTPPFRCSFDFSLLSLGHGKAHTERMLTMTMMVTTISVSQVLFHLTHPLRNPILLLWTFASSLSTLRTFYERFSMKGMGRHKGDTISFSEVGTGGKRWWTRPG